MWFQIYVPFKCNVRHYVERLSAGRVQSVALRLVCEREFEIERHVKEEYWSVFADLVPSASSGTSFAGELTHVVGRIGNGRVQSCIHPFRSFRLFRSVRSVHARRVCVSACV